MEIDPNGLSPKQAGAKLDAGKPKAAQILGMFAHALWEVAKVGTFGADKYSMGGWQSVENGEKRYADAAMRHFLKQGMGEDLDSDSELLHLSHEAWNALAKLELHLRGLKNGKIQMVSEPPVEIDLGHEFREGICRVCGHSKKYAEKNEVKCFKNKLMGV